MLDRFHVQAAGMLSAGEVGLPLDVILSTSLEMWWPLLIIQVDISIWHPTDHNKPDLQKHNNFLAIQFTATPLYNVHGHLILTFVSKEMPNKAIK